MFVCICTLPDGEKILFDPQPKEEDCKIGNYIVLDGDSAKLVIKDIRRITKGTNTVINLILSRLEQ